MDVQRNLVIAALMLALVVNVGILGYEVLEGWSMMDALYMTVITLSSVGYGEVHELSKEGRIFTVVLILCGLGVLMYVATTGISFLVEGQLGGLLKRKKMDKKIAKLKQHYIICASGEMGVYTIEEIYKMKHDFVVVSDDTGAVLPWVKSKDDILYIESDPAKDNVLLEAGVERAKGLTAMTGDDRENLFVALSARQINPDLKIVSQAVERDNVIKLKKAGADEVVSSMEIGAMRIASTMIRPTVVGFLDKMLYVKDKVLRMEERAINADSPLVGKKLGGCNVLDKTGLLVIAVKDAKTGEYTYNPTFDYMVNAGDVWIVLGDVNQLGKLSALIEKGA